MNGQEPGSFAALIALKLVCCGGLLLAIMGTQLLASVLAFLGNPLVQAVGVGLLVLAGALLVHRLARLRPPRDGCANAAVHHSRPRHHDPA